MTGYFETELYNYMVLQKHFFKELTLRSPMIRWENITTHFLLLQSMKIVFTLEM